MAFIAIERRPRPVPLIMALVAAGALLLTGCAPAPPVSSEPVTPVPPALSPGPSSERVSPVGGAPAVQIEPAETVKKMLPGAVLAEVAPVVQAIRGLPAVEIEPGLMSREELAAYLLEAITEDYPPEDQELDRIEWDLLGILAPAEDILELQLELLGEGILGFYDEDEKTMFAIEAGDAGAGVLKFVLTHEYVHALQDAAFDLGAIDEAIGKDNVDAVMAFTAMVEGDATAAGLAAFYRVVIREELTQFLTRERRGSDLSPSRARTFLDELLGFSYTAGWEFVERLVEVGGWDLVDAAYTDLPASTEQILYPDKYLAGELPEDVDLPDLSASALLGWRELRRNVMGAFFLNLLFGGFAPGWLADGWGGDEYAIYQDGMDNLLVMKMRWDAPAADDFWANATIFLQEDWLDRFRAGQGRTLVASDLVTWQKGFRSARLFRDGDDVYLVVGTDAAAVERVWEQLADGTTARPQGVYSAMTLQLSSS